MPDSPKNRRESERDRTTADAGFRRWSCVRSLPRATSDRSLSATPLLLQKASGTARGASSHRNLLGDAKLPKSYAEGLDVRRLAGKRTPRYERSGSPLRTQDLETTRRFEFASQ